MLTLARTLSELWKSSRTALYSSSIEETRRTPERRSYRGILKRLYPRESGEQKLVVVVSALRSVEEERRRSRSKSHEVSRAWLVHVTHGGAA